jgi:hypothetical protein
VEPPDRADPPAAAGTQYVQQLGFIPRREDATGLK